MRVFTAVLPPLELRERVAGRASAWSRELPRARWIRAENLHLTLAFLGEVDPDARGRLEAALGASLAGCRSLVARTGGLGAFPERGPLRVIWLGLEPAEALAGLAGRVREAIAAAGLESDAKPFRSHLTLARARPPWPPGTRSRLAALAPDPEPFPVEAVSLVESVLGPGGARYRVLAEHRLAEAA